MVFLKEMDYRMMNSMNSDPFYSSPFSVFPGRRHAPYMGQPDFRIYELNKRLQQRTEVTTLLNFVNYFSLVMRKPVLCICENKDADQLRGNREADQRLCFRHMDSTIPLLSKSEISSL